MTRRWVALLLRAYPRRFRESHAAEVHAHFAAELDRAQGPGQRTAAWARSTIDLLTGALRARRSHRPRSHRPDHPRSDRSRGGGEPMYAFLDDLRYGARVLLRAPVVSLTVVITLALGIGLNSAIFSVVNGVLLEPLEYRDPERLVYITASHPNEEPSVASHSGGSFQVLRDASTTLAEAAALTVIQQNLTGVDLPRQVQVGWTTPNLFRLLGVTPTLGRDFADDEPPGAVILGHALWTNTFAGDAGVIGRPVRLDGVQYTVVGVMQPGFELHASPTPTTIDLWKVPDNQWANGDLWNAIGPAFEILSVIARLAPEANLEQARSELATIAANTRRDHTEYAETGYELGAVPLHERVVAEIRPSLLTLFGAVGFVLLIACANVANLLLVRAQARRQELSIRLALGSGRARLVRLLTAECLVLAGVGGAIGIALGAAGTRAVAMIAPAGLPRVDALGVDARVVAFTFGVALLSTTLAGLLPALSVARADLSSELRGTRAVSAGAATSNWLVIGQIALSLVLLIGAGLLGNSLLRLQQVETGFRSTDLLSFSFSLPGARYQWPEGTGRFFREFENAIEAIPGVESAGLVWPMPLSGSWTGTVAGGTLERERQVQAQYRLATPDFFETVAIPTVAGRGFEGSDPREVALVSQHLAERAWPGESAIGRTLQANPWGGATLEFEIVGVVGDVRYGDLRQPPGDTMYFDAKSWSWVDWEVDFVVRAGGDPLDHVEAIRHILAAMDPEVPMAEIQAMSTHLDSQLAPNRFALGLVGLFAGVAALLAAIGLYGVLSFSVSRRSREIGIRLALGSAPQRILRLVLGQGARITATGIVLGMVGAFWLTGFLSSFLFEVSTADPETFVGLSILLLAVGVAAAYLPARRATRCDPVSILRAE